MSKNALLAHVAAGVRNTEVQRYIFSMNLTELNQHLGQNPHLDEAIWMQLLLGASLDEAKDLYKRKLSQRQARTLLSESNLEVLQAALESDVSEIPSTLLRQIMEQGSEPGFESMVRYIQPQYIPDDMVKEAAASRHGQVHLASNLWRRSVYTDTEVIEHLGTASLHYQGRYLEKLFDLRPEVIEPALGLYRSELYGPLAGCRHLFDPQVIDQLITQLYASLRLEPHSSDAMAAMLVLAQNPNTTRVHLARIIQVLRASSRISKQIPCDLENNATFKSILAINRTTRGRRPVRSSWEKTTGVVRERILATTARRRRDRYPSLAPWFSKHTKVGELKAEDVSVWTFDYHFRNYDLVDDYLEAKLSPGGIAHWSLFINLLPSWQQDLASLVAVTTALH